MSLNIYSHRYKQGKEWTLSMLSVGGHDFTCYVLEDEKRKLKVNGETAIWKGRYEIKFREVMSEKTAKYRAKYPWFTWHLWLQDVPQFQFIYIHVGNVPDDSDGCLLVGHTRNEHIGHIGQSAAAFEPFYKMVSKHLDHGDQVFIEITEEPGLISRSELCNICS